MLNIRRDKDGATVDVGGEIDLYSGGQLLEVALGVIRGHDPRLAVDLAGVTFMDCGGVDVLLTIRRQARLHGGYLTVVSASAPVRRVLQIIGMDATLASAAARLGEGGEGEAPGCREQGLLDHGA